MPPAANVPPPAPGPYAMPVGNVSPAPPGMQPAGPPPGGPPGGNVPPPQFPVGPPVEPAPYQLPVQSSWSSSSSRSYRGPSFSGRGGKFTAAGVVSLILFSIIYFVGVKPALERTSKANQLLQEANRERNAVSTESNKLSAYEIEGKWDEVGAGGLHYDFDTTTSGGATVTHWSGTNYAPESHDVITGTYTISGNKVKIHWSNGLPDRTLTTGDDSSGHLIITDESGNTFSQRSY